MSEPFLGELRIIPFNFAPRGWAYCNGQILPINQNSALFSLLSTMYGGDGRTSFGLPDLRGRIPLHKGQGPGLSNRRQGQKYGEATHTLNSWEMPSHSHKLQAYDADGNKLSPIGNYYARELFNSVEVAVYSDTETVTMNPGMINNTGGSQSHNNMMPYLAVHYCIALQGILPLRES